VPGEVQPGRARLYGAGVPNEFQMQRDGGRRATFGTRGVAPGSARLLSGQTS
jgi:hypothetical protein